MARFGFVGSSYSSQSPAAADQRTINYYPERIEVADGKTGVALYVTPGTKLFAAFNAADVLVRGMLALNGRVFAIGKINLVELLSDKTIPVRGTLLAADRTVEPVSIVGSHDQLLMVSNGVVYSFDLAINNFGVPTGLLGPISKLAWCDGYFVALLRDSKRFQFSNLENAKVWDGLDVVEVNVFPDNIVGMLSDHRELWLFGRTRTVIYNNTGDADNPFQPTGYVIEQGIVAEWSPAKADNTIFWLGGDERGAGVVWRAQGYLPTRVSDHALEKELRGYSKISDAIGFAFQEAGHSFYQLTFPTANVSWRYDVAVGMWHQVARWSGTAYTAHQSQVHAYVDEFAGHPARQTLTSDNTNFANNETVTIGTTVYTFKTTLTPASWEVFIGADADTSLLNLARAIRFDGVNGTEYQVPSAHPSVSAGAVTAHAIVVSALTAGTAGNSIASTETCGHASWGAVTLLGGTDSTGPYRKHIVGDWNSPNLYELDSSYLDDDGQAIRRQRRCRHICNEQESANHLSLQIDTKVGPALAPSYGWQANHAYVVGAVIKPTAIPNGLAYICTIAGTSHATTEPVWPTAHDTLKTDGTVTWKCMAYGELFLKWSDDDTTNWSSEYPKSVGATGSVKLRSPIWRRLGQARDRIYDVYTLSPANIPIIDAYVKLG